MQTRLKHPKSCAGSTRRFWNTIPRSSRTSIAPDCVMESIQPAPDGTRYEGYDACLAFWEAIATDPVPTSRWKTLSRWATAPSSAGASISATADRFAAST